MSYHNAMKKLAEGTGAYAPGDCDHCDSPDCTGCPWPGGYQECSCGDPDCDDPACDLANQDDVVDDCDDSDEGRLRQRITDAMPEGDPEAYMASGQDLLNELLANPDRTKLEMILDKEIEELSALLGDTSDIDLEELKSAALAAFDAAAERDGPNRGAIMAALAAIKSAAGTALGALGLR